MTTPHPQNLMEKATLCRTRGGAWFTLVAACLFCSGCAANVDPQQYVPAEVTGQRALEIALTAWQNGAAPPGLVATGPPGIQLVDTHHKRDQTLKAFTVLGPTTGDAQRVYAVRLTLDNPAEEIRARFIVMGIDPLWVVRYEDYEMYSHWHCAPAEQPAAEPPGKTP